MSEHERWEALVDALAVEDAELDDAELDFIARFDEPAAQQEREVYDLLAAAGEPGQVHDVDRQRAEQTLAAFRQQSGRARRGWATGASVGAVVAIAAAVLLWWAWPAPDAILAPEGPMISSGVMMLDDAELSPGDPLPVDRWVVARGRACVTVGAATGCASSASRLRVDDTRIELSEGSVELSGIGRVVTTLGSVVAAYSDSRVEVKVERSTLHVNASEGRVELHDRDGSVQTLAAGEEASRSTEVASGPASADVPSDEAADSELDAESGSRSTNRRRAKPRPSASELLSAARSHVASGDTGRAISTYASLRRNYPGTPEARAANVSIGELELRRGRAKAALKAFGRYLSGGGGALAEEAHWGKIRALHRLGRAKQRDAAIAALRRAHPSSVYISRASSL